MIKKIQFLIENPEVLILLKEDKISLIGINESEKQAILEAFESSISTLNLGWR